MTPIPPLNFTSVSSAAAWRTIPRESTKARMVFSMVCGPQSVLRPWTLNLACLKIQRSFVSTLQHGATASRLPSARIGLRGGLVHGLLLLPLEIMGLFADVIELAPRRAVLRGRPGGPVQRRLGDEGDEREREDEDDDLSHAASITRAGRYEQ